MSWRRRTPYITAYNELRQKHYDDIKELKKLPNVTIRYNQMLHAKYYANESHSIISSMNLYSHSENNHECGVLLSQIDSQKMDDDAFKYFTRIVEQSKIIFQNKTIYKRVNEIYEIANLLNKRNHQKLNFSKLLVEISKRILNENKFESNLFFL